MFRHPLRFPREHRFTLEHASDYVDGDLDDAGRAIVERHARFCPRCRELLAALHRTVTALRELRTEREPVGNQRAARVIAWLRAER